MSANKQICLDGIGEEFIPGETVYLGKPTVHDCGVEVYNLNCRNCSNVTLVLRETFEELSERGELGQYLGRSMFCRSAIESVAGGIAVDTTAVLTGTDSVVQ